MTGVPAAPHLHHASSSITLAPLLLLSCVRILQFAQVATPPPTAHASTTARPPYPLARDSQLVRLESANNIPPINSPACHCRDSRPHFVSRLPLPGPARPHLHLPTFPLRRATMDSDVSSLSSLTCSRASSPLSSLGRRTPSPPPQIQLSDAVRTMYNAKSRTRSRVDPSLPTPPPSQENSQSGSPAPDAVDSSMLSDKDGPPPAKRRRVGPKERTTRSLDLRHEKVNPDEQPQFDDMLRTLHKCQKIVVVAGAGISVAAGSTFN